MPLPLKCDTTGMRTRLPCPAGRSSGLPSPAPSFSGRRIRILDKPASGFDGWSMRLIAEKLKSEARHGRTILVITHDRERIERCCDNAADVGKRSP